MVGEKVYVIGCGMTKFEKPGTRSDFDYPDMVKEACTKALIDAKLSYKDVQYATCGYCYGDSTSGQRSLYQLGMTQIPIINVNNNCSTGSTSLYLARQAIQSGLYGCAMAVGFEKMKPGSLGSVFNDRTNPLDKIVDNIAHMHGLTTDPITAQIFGRAGMEHNRKYGSKPEHMAKIAVKNHKHSILNPYSQFRDEYSLDEILASKRVFGPLTRLQCCPTSDGAACAILANERFIKQHQLEDIAIEIVAQVMVTDADSYLDDCIEMAGSAMTRRASKMVFEQARLSPEDIDVVELHDCFSANELISYEALGLCELGKAHLYVDSGTFTYGGQCVVNPSGGLISKGHPLGATGLAQCTELIYQLRGWCGKRQVPNAKYALQHNIGLGGAVVVTIYGKKSTIMPPPPYNQFGYNPAIECRRTTTKELQQVIASKAKL